MAIIICRSRPDVSDDYLVSDGSWSTDPADAATQADQYAASGVVLAQLDAATQGERFSILDTSTGVRRVPSWLQV